MHPIGAGAGWDGCYEVLQWETFGKAAFTFCAQLYFHLAKWMAFLGMCPVPIFCPFGVRASPKASGAPAHPLLHFAVHSGSVHAVLSRRLHFSFSRRQHPSLQRKRAKRPRKELGGGEPEVKGRRSPRTSVSAAGMVASWCCVTASPAPRPTTCHAWAWASGPSVGERVPWWPSGVPVHGSPLLVTDSLVTQVTRPSPGLQRPSAEATLELVAWEEGTGQEGQAAASALHFQPRFREITGACVKILTGILEEKQALSQRN